MSLNRPIWKLRDWIDLEKLDKLSLSLNPNAINFLEANQNKINWNNLSFNPNAIKLLNEKRDRIDYCNLSANPNTMKLLEDNIDNIYWYELSRNPSIFELDYETMKRNNEGIYEELIKEVMKPSRVFKNPDYDYIEVLFGD